MAGYVYTNTMPCRHGGAWLPAQRAESDEKETIRNLSNFQSYSLFLISTPTSGVKIIMNAAALSLEVVSTFKELYLLSKFIVKKVRSAKDWKTEKQDLEDNFKEEVIFLRCIFRVFLQNHGVVDNEQLNDVCRTTISRHGPLSMTDVSG